MSDKTIKQRVAEQRKELTKAGTLPAGLSVVIGQREQAQMLLEADTSFLFDMASGNMNLCGLPVVIKNVTDYFAVEVPSGPASSHCSRLLGRPHAMP